MSEIPISDQELVRREELRALRAHGVDPYPSETFEVTLTAAAAPDRFTGEPEPERLFTLAGRLMTKRVMGKASFAVLLDATGTIQLYVSRDDVAPGDDKFLYNDLFKKLISLGDFVGVRGYLFRTQTGELTLHVTELKLLAKCLRPLPVAKEKDGVVYDAFTDPEQRYRMRYVDLIVNPHVREIFRKRTALYTSIRNFLNTRGYLEVETPILQPLYGGAYARPFVTHHNTLDMDLYLRVANELYLKRLIVGGFDGVYEFAKDFRNEGMSRFHNPEFTQIELYVAFKDYLWMMELLETMIEQAAVAVTGGADVSVGGRNISFARPWKRYTFYGAIEHFTGHNLRHAAPDEMLTVLRALGVHYEGPMDKASLADEIFGTAVEPKLVDPTFITDYPLEMSPLAKKHRSEPGLVERFEVICNGKEICNAYTELNDPDDQRLRFMEQARVRAGGNDEAMQFDEDFIRALEYGLPPTTGLGIGLDRLTMIFTDAPSIQEVLFFPQMRPEPRPRTLTAEALAAAGLAPEWSLAFAKAGLHHPEDVRRSAPEKLAERLNLWRDLMGLTLEPMTPQLLTQLREILNPQPQQLRPS